MALAFVLRAIDIDREQCNPFLATLRATIQILPDLSGNLTGMRTEMEKHWFAAMGRKGFRTVRQDRARKIGG